LAQKPIVRLNTWIKKHTHSLYENGSQNVTVYNVTIWHIWYLFTANGFPHGGSGR
jgi:hypothetical protein